MNTAQEMAAIVYKALDDKKAFDIKILDIKKISAELIILLLQTEQTRIRYRRCAIVWKKKCTKPDIL